MTNLLGEYLPDTDAQPKQESKRIQANNQREANKKCEEIAQQYGGTDANAKPIGEKLFDCKFKL